jgi:hypothetical protein
MTTANLEDLNNIQLNVHFANPKPQEKVDLEVWYSSYDDKSMYFMKRLGLLLKRVNHLVNFKPRTASWSCPQCDSDFKKKNCYGNGLYCAFEK